MVNQDLPIEVQLLKHNDMRLLGSLLSDLMSPNLEQLVEYKTSRQICRIVMNKCGAILKPLVPDMFVDHEHADLIKRASVEEQTAIAISAYRLAKATGVVNDATVLFAKRLYPYMLYENGGAHRPINPYFGFVGLIDAVGSVVDNWSKTEFNKSFLETRDADALLRIVRAIGETETQPHLFHRQYWLDMANNARYIVGLVGIRTLLSAQLLTFFRSLSHNCGQDDCDHYHFIDQITALLENPTTTAEDFVEFFTQHQLSVMMPAELDKIGAAIYRGTMDDIRSVVVSQLDNTFSLKIESDFVRSTCAQHIGNLIPIESIENFEPIPKNASAAKVRNICNFNGNNAFEKLITAIERDYYAQLPVKPLKVHVGVKDKIEVLRQIVSAVEPSWLIDTILTQLRNASYSVSEKYKDLVKDFSGCDLDGSLDVAGKLDDLLEGYFKDDSHSQKKLSEAEDTLVICIGGVLYITEYLIHLGDDTLPPPTSAAASLVSIWSNDVTRALDDNGLSFTDALLSIDWYEVFGD